MPNIEEPFRSISLSAMICNEPSKYIGTPDAAKQPEVPLWVGWFCVAFWVAIFLRHTSEIK